MILASIFDTDILAACDDLILGGEKCCEESVSVGLGFCALWAES